MATPKYRTLLLLPKHTTPTPPHFPLLKSLQSLLNAAYTATYCAHPDIFGTEHCRIADPSQLADIIGEAGFTIAILHLQDGAEGQVGGEYGDAEGLSRAEVVATGSVKDFGDGEVESYAAWSGSVSGTQCAAGKEESGGNRSGTSFPGGENDV
jgi:hypothetical protein